MGRLRILRILVAVTAIAAVCAPVKPQAAPEVSGEQPKINVIHDVEVPMPFSPDSDKNTHSIEFRTVDQMTAKDRDLEADAESSISEHAGVVGLEFNEGKWSYRQVVCRALPNHMFLQFTRNNGVGDVSVFSASIPRNGEGRIRIVPILLRGYSLFSPAPINAMTISAFNHIRAEEYSGQVSDWLGTALCYAALAGGHPKAAVLTEESESEKYAAAMPTLLEIPFNGGAIIQFLDLGATPRPMEWTMTFDGNGKLLKATHSASGVPSIKADLPAAFELEENPSHESAKGMQVRQVPPYYDAEPAEIPAP